MVSLAGWLTNLKKQALQLFMLTIYKLIATIMSKFPVGLCCFSSMNP